MILPKQNNSSGKYRIYLEELRPANEKDFALDEARRLNFEATTLWLAYKYDEALPLAQHALSIREKESGADDFNVASSLTTLEIREKISIRIIF